MARFAPIRLAHRVFEAVGGSDMKKPPVIFMHAMLCSKEIWESIPQRVADATKRKVYTYDARNHGESEHTTSYKFEDNLEDLYNFMGSMEITDSVLVGHSFGGMTAIGAALQMPSRVERAFIVDMHVRKVQSELIQRSIKFMNTWTEVVRSLPKNIPEEDVTRISVPILFEKLPEDMQMQSEKEAYLLSKFMYKRKEDGGYDMLFNPEAIAGALQQYMKSPIINSGYYEGPAHFIYGSKSPFNVGSEEENIKECFPNAEMIEFKGASHHLFVDFSQKFTETLIDRMEMPLED